MEAMREDERGREEQGMGCVMMVMVMVMVSLFPVQSSPVQSGLSVWLSSSTARLNQYFLLASYLTYRIALHVCTRSTSSYLREKTG